MAHGFSCISVGIMTRLGIIHGRKWMMEPCRLTAAVVLFQGLLVLLAIGWAESLDASQPFINSSSDTLVLQKDAEISIMCSGNRPIAWKLSESWQSRSRTVNTSRTAHSEDSSYLYTSQLTVRSLHRSDTGYFECAYLTSVASEKAVSRIYVYVTDPDRLFTKTPLFEMFAVHQGVTFTFPCRLSDPAAKVTLVKDENNQRVVGADVTYNPRIGFIIDKTAVFYNGPFSCIATLGNRTDSWRGILFYKAETSIPQPEVRATHSQALVGEEVEFTCTVSVRQGVSAYLEWKYSSDEHSERIEEVPVTHHSVKKESYVYDEIIGKLKIHGVRMSDRGVYRCTITNHDGKENFREATIYIYEKTFVHLHPKQKLVEVTLGQKSASLVFSLNAYPLPNMTWSKNSVPISPGNRRFEMRLRPDRAKLNIYQPTEMDSGNYTLTAITKDMRKSESIQFVVMVPPHVKMTVPETSPFYTAHEYHSLHCVTRGVPAPSVQWEWQACAHVGCAANASAWRLVTPVHNAATVHKAGAELVLRARESGFYRCIATNKLGRVEAYTQFVVTDVHGGFGFGEKYPSRINPVVGDDVRIFCNASFIKFVQPFFYWSHDGHERRLRSSDAGISIINSRNKYSHTVELILHDIGFDSVGLYSCKTKDLLGSDISTQVQVSVRQIENPVFVKSIEGTVYVKPDSKYGLVCDAVGVPTPEISWTKDGKTMTEKLRAHVAFNHNKTSLVFDKITTNDSGIYACTATNRGTSVVSRRTLHVQFAVPDGRLSGSQIGLIIGISLVILIVMAIIIFCLVRRYMRLKYFHIEQYLLAAKDAIYNPDIPIDEQCDCLGYDPRWEFPREHLKFDMQLGQGAFGKVMKAEAMDIMEPGTNTTVAVKTVKDLADREQVKALLSELKLMIHIGNHLNILNVLGAVTKDFEKGYLYVIMEYCAHGSLRDYLLAQRPHFVDTMDPMTCGGTSSAGAPCDKSAEARADASTSPAVQLNYMNVFSTNDSAGGMCAAYSADPSEHDRMIALSTKDLVCYAFQIARGMDYLASRKYIHRDLAARNVLLAEDNVVKICDFGLAKDCCKYGSEYKKKSSSPVPVKWLALESLTHRVYTTKSDVWSYGILLWELFTLGGNPYPGIPIDETFIRRVKCGYRMERPTYATEAIHACIRQCWNAEPDERPSFAELSDSFGDLLQGTDKQLYLDLNSDYLRAKSTEAVNEIAAATTSERDHVTDLINMPLPVKTKPVPAPRSTPPSRPLKQHTAPLLMTAAAAPPPDEPAEHETESPPNGLPAAVGVRPVQMRAKKVGDGNNSVTSDASSGFHSDCITDMDSAPPNYDLVMRHDGQA